MWIVKDCLWRASFSVKAREISRSTSQRKILITPGGSQLLNSVPRRTCSVRRSLNIYRYKRGKRKLVAGFNLKKTGYTLSLKNLLPLSMGFLCKFCIRVNLNIGSHD